MIKNIFLPIKRSIMFLTLLTYLLITASCKKDEVIPQDTFIDHTGITTETSSTDSLSIPPAAIDSIYQNVQADSSKINIDNNDTDENVSSIYANTFGAIPDDNQSDKSAINRAIIYAQEHNINEVRLEPGTYIIDNDIVMSSNVTLNGLDKTKTKLLADPASNGGFSFILFSNVHRAGIKNLYIDGNAVKRKTTKGNGCIFITNGSKYNTIEKLTIANFGSPNVGGGGNYITLSASESTGESSYNTIANCELIDANHYSKFGIRLYTSWNEAIPTESFTNKVAFNLVTNCTLTGFTWNCIELAGPATVSNKVTYCHIKNSIANAGINIDKGASRNEISNNTVENIQPNKDGFNTYAYRCYGLTKAQNSSGYDRPAVGNKFYNNKAININNTTVDNTGGLLIQYAKDAEVKNNSFSNINYGSDNRAAGIFISSARNLIISGNLIEKVQYGTFVIGGSDNYSVTISGNTFSYVHTAYKSFEQGVKSAFQFLNNILSHSGNINSTNETSSIFK